MHLLRKVPKDLSKHACNLHVSIMFYDYTFIAFILRWQFYVFHVKAIDLLLVDPTIAIIIVIAIVIIGVIVKVIINVIVLAVITKPNLIKAF